MNLMLFFWRIFSIGVTLSVTNGQGSTCPISKGTPSVVNKVLGSIDAEQKCAEACKTRTNCIWWQFKKRTNECSIAQLKINDDRKVNFAMKNCDSPPTTIPGLESLLAEVKNISRVVEDLKEKNENGLNSLNEKLTNVESQNQVLQSDFMEQTNQTMEKIDSTYNDMKNDFQALNQQLLSLNEQTNMTKMEIKEKIDVKFDVAYNDHKTLKNLSKDLGSELKKLIVETVNCKFGYSLDPTTGQCYTVLNDKGRNWTDAKSECEAQGAELASVRSSVEWQFVKGLLQASGVTNVWLGGTDEAVEGTWVWTDRSPVTFSDWLPGRPTIGTVANCMASHVDDSWRWYDAGCSAAIYTVCKIPEIILDEVRNISRAIEDLKEQNEKLLEVSIGMTLEEYETKEMYCSTNGDFFDINAGFCYKYIVLNDTERTWDEARSQCSTLRGDLASIKSIQEWEVVKGHLRASGIYGESSAWIGLRDEGIEGTWMWTDGSPVTFSNWGPGRPYSRTSSTSWNCVAIGAYDGDMWRWAEILGDGCSEYRSAVCKKRVEA